jgi:hypothetical protein
VITKVDDWILDQLQELVDRSGISLRSWRRWASMVEGATWLWVVISGIQRGKGFDWIAGLLAVIAFARFSFAGSDGIYPESDSRCMNPRRISERGFRVWTLAIVAVAWIFLGLGWRNYTAFALVHVVHIRSALEALTQGPPRKRRRLRVLVPVFEN